MPNQWAVIKVAKDKAISNYIPLIFIQKRLQARQDIYLSCSRFTDCRNVRLKVYYSQLLKGYYSQYLKASHSMRFQENSGWFLNSAS